MRNQLLKWVLRESARNLCRHTGRGTVAALTVALAISIWGAFLLISRNAQEYLVSNVRHSTDVHVFLQKNAGLAEAKEVENQLNAMEEVEKYRFTDKATGMEWMQKRFGNHRPFEELLGYNPLQHQFSITLHNLEQPEDCILKLKQMSHVEDVVFDREQVNGVVAILKTMRHFAVIVCTLLALAALTLIYNTVHLTIQTRQDEIGIMSIFGATLRLIKIPFILEGVVYGVVGSLTATLILYTGYGWLTEWLGRRVPMHGLLTSHEIGWSWWVKLTLSGSLLGSLSGWLAVERLVKYR